MTASRCRADVSESICRLHAVVECAGFDPIRIAILGSCGVGGYFGGRLAAAGSDVAFIARGAHLAALRNGGLRIESPQGGRRLERVTANDDPAARGPVGIVFFTVKRYDTEAAARMLPPLIGPDTLVVTFQNGVDSADVLARSVGPERVAGGTAYVAAVIAEPGLIRLTAMGRLTFCPLDPPARRCSRNCSRRAAPRESMPRSMIASGSTPGRNSRSSQSSAAFESTSTRLESASLRLSSGTAI